MTDDFKHVKTISISQQAFDALIVDLLREPAVNEKLLALFAPAVPADERAQLVAAIAALKTEESQAHEVHQERLERTIAAEDALTAYDEAHRTPTFAEKVAGLGIGAVLIRDDDGRVVVRFKADRWIADTGPISVTYQSSELHNGEVWRILSEGVRVPAADEGVE